MPSALDTMMRLTRMHPRLLAHVDMDQLEASYRRALDAGRAVIARLSCGRTLFYTWLRSPRPIFNGVPEPEDWTSTKGVFWLVDVVAEPGASPGAVRREIENDLRTRGIASPGEPIVFYRVQSERYGYVRMRTLT